MSPPPKVGVEFIPRTTPDFARFPSPTLRRQDSNHSRDLSLLPIVPRQFPNQTQTTPLSHFASILARSASDQFPINATLKP